MKANEAQASDGTRYRQLQKLVSGVVTTDGDGVNLTRIIGSSALEMLDPFLLLDCFESDDSKDYIGGFPTHPHRGFETVTYLLDGKMRHQDSAGNQGVVEPGGVQWMTAGRGILHSEMPEQKHGLLKGFQLWVNLPGAAKMVEPQYQEFSPEDVVQESLDDGTKVRVIAGKTPSGTIGPVVNTYTYPIYLDISLPPGARFAQAMPNKHNAFVYVIDGEINIYAANQTLETSKIAAGQLGVLTDGELLTIVNANQPSRLLLVAGKPINEPVVRGGPFVMNSREEVLQAYDDYSKGNFDN